MPSLMDLKDDDKDKEEINLDKEIEKKYMGSKDEIGDYYKEDYESPIDIKAVELRMALYLISKASVSLGMKEYWKRLKKFVNTHELVETSNRDYIIINKI